MHTLIVYANPEPTSFTAALVHRTTEVIQVAGGSVEVSDLFREGFNPVAGRHDFQSVADPTRFHYQTEQAKAASARAFSDDVAREQDRVRRADLVIFTFPLWWGGPPAILKGWLERVLAYGFAYVDGARFDSVLFKDKRGLLCVVTGGTPERFSESGVYGPIDKVRWPMQRLALGYMGMSLSDPFVAYAAPRIDAEASQRYLSEWARRVATTQS